MTQEFTTGPVWKIIDVTDTTIFDRTLGVMAGKRVTFQLFNGKRSYIDVPLDKFDSATVSTLIDDAAGNIVDIMALEGPLITSGGMPPKPFESP